MRLPLRLILESASETYSPAEQHQLFTSVSAAPGVESTEEPSRHPRGGYWVVVQYAGESIDALLAHLQSCGYRAVI